MKTTVGETQVVIGKRITIGAAIAGLSEGIQFFFPEHAPAIGSFTIPVIFIVQLLIAHNFGITTKE